MGRHEIRLRRKKMTSRRIESHKNYYEVLKKHEKSSFGRRLVRLVIYILIFIGLMFLAYYVLQKIEDQSEAEPIEDVQVVVQNNIPAGCFNISFIKHQKQWKNARIRKRT